MEIMPFKILVKKRKFIWRRKKMWQALLMRLSDGVPLLRGLGCHCWAWWGSPCHFVLAIGYWSLGTEVTVSQSEHPGLGLPGPALSSLPGLDQEHEGGACCGCELWAFVVRLPRNSARKLRLAEVASFWVSSLPLHSVLKKFWPSSVFVIAPNDSNPRSFTSSVVKFSSWDRPWSTMCKSLCCIVRNR